MLDERPTPATAGYQAPDDRSTWLGSVVRRESGDFALFVDDIQGRKCAGEAAYYLTATALATGTNPLGPFKAERIISPQVTMHPTATVAPTGETIVTTFTSAANRPMPSSSDCSAAAWKTPCSAVGANCRPNRGFADANMTLELLIGNASAPGEWEHLPILSSSDLPGKYSSDWEAVWGTWDPSHAILPDGTTFVSTAHGNVTRGVFLFRAPHFRGPYTPVGSGPVVKFRGKPVQTCDPFLFHTSKRGGALHLIANNCGERGFPDAGGYVHAVAPAPDYTDWSLTGGSAACLEDRGSAACEHPIANSIRLLGGGTVPFSSSRQSLTILFDGEVPIVAYTNLIGARAGRKWTEYKSDSSLNAVPIGARGAEFAAAFAARLERASDAAPVYPPCQPGGSTVPPVVKHPDSVYPGPGRITEKGQVLDGPGLTIYRNVTVRGNTFVANGRFLDVGATEGVAVSANRILTPQGGAPTSDVRVYGSSGFDAAATVHQNVCEVAGKSVPCSVAVER